jgi:cytidylate kinase
MIVTIDGPAASGKSTTARLVAKELGWLYLDTGAMYRALTVKVLREKVRLKDTQKIAQLAETTVIDLVPSEDGIKVLLDGEEVTSDIRHPDVDRAVGPVCEIPRIRDIMVSIQRRMSENREVIAEGRDMGTVVFPDAELKFYVVASLDERTRRRQRDLTAQGIHLSQKRIKGDIEKRDHRDSSREMSPLRMAEDAILLNTTEMDIGAQVQFVVDKIKQYVKYGLKADHV